MKPARALVLGLGLLAVSCGGPAETPSGGAPGGPEAEFKRHLELAVGQIRLHLADSARAELDACARIRPDDPELLFHRARLELMREGGDAAAAEALLERVLAQEPHSVKTRRMLYEIEKRAGRPDAERHLQPIAEAYGQIGLFEMTSHAAYLAGQKDPYLRFVEERPGAPYLAEYRELRDSLLRLNRDGNYAPTEAVPRIESLLRQFPDLAVVRMSYAKKLVLGEVRVNYSDRPGLPPMSSTLILDTAQQHYERAFDQLDPTSPLAQDALYMLGHTSLLMGDYDEAVTYVDILLASPQTSEGFRAHLLGRRALARHKQGRQREAIELLEQSLAGMKEPDLATRWVLRLAHEAAGTPLDQRPGSFVLRPDLVHPAGAEAFEFEDIAERMGVAKRDGVGPSAWGDYDGDGDFDLFVTGSDSYGALYRNDGDRFTDVSREAGLFQATSGFSTTFVDYDGDGDPDLHVGRDGWSGPSPNSLYRNNGDGTFTDVTEHAGLADPGSSFVCAWSDVDRDGDPDLAVANGITGAGDTNRLYRNNGDGTFTDVTQASGLAEPAGTRTIGLAFGDYDLDGWPDLFVSGFTVRNRLYHNDGDGTFTEVAERAGVASADDRVVGYVAFFFDYDNDQDLDILRTALAPWSYVLAALDEGFDTLPTERRREMQRHCPKLYRNDGDGHFTEVGAQAGLIHPIGIMGAGVADLDNDGWLDLYFGTGDPAIERMEPDRFYRNNGDGTFSDLTFAVGLGNIGKGHGITFVDLDGDGDLEIYAPEGGFVHGDSWPNALYVNRRDSPNHWLHVDLEGRESNIEGLDAKLLVRAGGRSLLREAHNGEGFGSSNSPTIEFGLGSAERVERLEIRWPSGKVQSFDDVPVDRRIVVVEGEPWRLWERGTR